MQKTTIYVDADACPAAIKEILFRTAKRVELETILVANGAMHVPQSPFIRMLAVRHGADVADNQIVELMQPGDLVVTDDIPLAARVVEKGGTAIGTRGQMYDDDSVHSRLATRDLMDQLRSAGVDTKGPKPLDKKDIQAFASQLDRTVTRLLKKQRK